MSFNYYFLLVPLAWILNLVRICIFIRLSNLFIWMNIYIDSQRVRDSEMVWKPLCNLPSSLRPEGLSSLYL